ncbi:MAG: metallophosphoesterase, partial [Nitrospirota bacterium]|nr:metallophosphoesterase [Nitrospirota bacterium]
TLSARAAFLLPFVPALIVTGYALYEAGNIRIDRHIISSAKIPKDAGKITIAQISDVHVGLIVRERQLGKIVAAVKKANPDILVATGDLVDGQINHLDGLSTLLTDIKPRYGKFAVTGNHEFFAGIDQSLDFMRRAGFTVLRDEWVGVAGAVTIAGVDDPVARRFGRAPMLSEKDLLQRLPSDQFRLFLKHRPEIEDGSPGLFDLQLSGHTHRGQIFPFRFLVKIYYPYLSGRFDLSSGSILYVNRGSGTWGPPLRFLSPPEVTVIDLVPAR